ncbi:zinc knuckle protein, putative (macronuclear) [Tetrahymena thermophila SB210]|uniref:Zinc knuckle protein, putative n=1 Tax=Tetrahymena thermophila (strain SB210) TaxID=312017 RepID=Q23YS0_TETTS|nr:zinc knuckle protein, putative [Tetrahymena thermophila SB210]EAS01735.1 zinc knuckle protein, putative [Tetrahymena thermophila SB210]|eukprot:XP_001021980.1 zinc knuckle protein, putative [Tetrahymena thermophila SB210]
MKKTSRFASIVKLVDIYGIPINVNFQNDDTHRTTFGAIISILVFLTFGLATYFYGQELFYKTNPIVITSEQYVKNPERMTIDKEKQIIVMGFNTAVGKTVYDPSIIQVRATISQLVKVYNQTTQTYSSSLQATPLNIRPCNSNDIKSDKVKDYFNALNLNQYFCFDDNQEVFVEGDYSGDFYSRVDVYFSQCKNSTIPGSTVCKPQSVINNVASNLYFLAYMIDKIIDPTNLEEPFDYRGFNIETQTSIFQSQQFVAFFENYYVQSDTGFLQKSLQQIRDFMYVQSSSSNLYGQDGLLVQFTLRPYKNKQLIMERRYMKFSDLVAQLGGILKLVTVIGFVLTYPFAKIHLDKEIINSIFDFDFSQDENNDKNENNNQHQKYMIGNNQSANNQMDKSQFSFQKETSQRQNDISYNFQPQSQYDCNQSNIQQIKQISQQNSNTERKEEQYMKAIKNQEEQLRKENFKEIEMKNQTQLDISQSMNLSKSQNLATKTKFTQQTTKRNERNQNSLLESQALKSESQIAKENELKQSFLNRIRNILNPHKERVKLTCSEYLSFFIKCTRSKMLQLKKQFIIKGVDKVQSHLDIQYILQKLQEIDKLKQILLNDDQIKLFELLPRPVMKNGEDKGNKKKANQFYEKVNQSYEEKVNNAIQSLINILNQEKKSVRDHQLIQLLDDYIYKTMKDNGLLSNYASNPKQSYPNYPQLENSNHMMFDEVNEEQNSARNQNKNNKIDINDNNNKEKAINISTENNQSKFDSPQISAVSSDRYCSYFK